MVLNIDIKFLLFILTLVYIIVKLVKLKPWQYPNQNSLPLSFINKKNRIRKKSIQDLKQKIYQRLSNQNQNQNDNKMSDKQQNVNISSQQSPNKTIKSSQTSILWNLYLQKNNQLLNNKLSNSVQLIIVDKNTPIISNFQSTDLQIYFYQFINKTIDLLKQFIWYLKWKSIAFLWLLLLLIYIFQPQIHKDMIHIIARQKDGQFQIQGIRRASEYINEFYLILICIIVNCSIWYRYSTSQLRKQLTQQIYTTQYRQQLIHKTRFKAKRLKTNNDDNDLLLMKQRSKSFEQVSPKAYHTLVYKKDRSRQQINSPTLDKKKISNQPYVSIDSLKQFYFRTQKKSLSPSPSPQQSAAKIQIQSKIQQKIQSEYVINNPSKTQKGSKQSTLGGGNSEGNVEMGSNEFHVEMVESEEEIEEEEIEEEEMEEEQEQKKEAQQKVVQNQIQKPNQNINTNNYFHTFNAFNPFNSSNSNKNNNNNNNENIIKYKYQNQQGKSINKHININIINNKNNNKNNITYHDYMSSTSNNAVIGSNYSITDKNMTETSSPFYTALQKPSSSIIQTHANNLTKPKLYRKSAAFLPMLNHNHHQSSTQNVLSNSKKRKISQQSIKVRKLSDDYKMKQKYDDFKISLFKVEVKNKDKINQVQRI